MYAHESVGVSSASGNEIINNSIIMNRKKNLFISMAALLLVGGVSSCTDDLSESDHYKAPDRLMGNAYEVLQGEGNHSIFLRGVDLSDYKSIVQGNSIVTVMAPDDNAFRKFLEEKGVKSIDDLDRQYLNKLIGYHLMYYAFDWSKMVNFRPTNGDGATDEEKEEFAGYFYKHRTHSIDPIEQKRVKLSPDASSDTLIYVYHNERYLPVFSNKLFETKKIDADYNYTYFFPNTEWKGEGGAKGVFNVANAKVKDNASVVTDNGYLYHVDHVIEPLNTIYDELSNDPDYSDYISLYDSYSTYVPASDEVNTSLGYVAYVHQHGALPPIALEWPVQNWQQVSTLERAGYNVFAPSNAAMDEFFRTYWTAEGGYTTLDDLDPEIKRYFIYQTFAADNFIVFPEEIKNGDVTTSFGTPVTIDPDQVTDRKICANGVLYGMDKMEAPAIFSSVAGPAFKDKRYVTYLYALTGSEKVLALASKNTDFVALIPDNDQFAATDPAIRLYQTTNGKQIQQFSSDAGDFVEMGKSALETIVDMHTAQNVSSLDGEGTKVITTNRAYNYWFVKDGKITTNAVFNQQLEPTYTGTPFVSLTKIENNGESWSNGNAYAYGATAIFEPASGDGLGRKFAVCNDKNYPYYMFAQLLQKAGLITGNELSSSITSADGRFFAFVPTNAAITAHLSEIPGCGKLTVTDGTLSGTPSGSDKTALANYLRSYFVNSVMNSFTAYPYIGSTCKGEFNTAGSHRMNVADDGTKLTVNFVNSGKAVDVVADYSYLPFAFNDGCFHLIGDILE